MAEGNTLRATLSLETGPAVGEALAQWVHRGEPGVPLDAFAIQRFTAVPVATPN